MRRLLYGLFAAACAGLVLSASATYPSGVKSFTTKSAGDTVQATHINDLQDEVTAIETGLINGINHALILASTLDVQGIATFTNTGLHLLDTDASHDLIVKPGSNLTADRTFTIVTGDANRTLTLGADVTLSGTPYVAGGTDVAVADGGTNLSSYTKGDLLVASGATTLAKRAVGSDGQVLTAASGQTDGVQWATPTAGLGYVLFGGANLSSPADATTYYFGGIPQQGIQTTEALVQMYAPAAGRITKVSVLISGSNGTNEASTMSVRLNATSDTTISASVVCNAIASGARFTNAALAITVAAGDLISIKWVAPTWATNPTGVLLSVILYIET